MRPFSLLVLGDTQYLFDGDRSSPELLTETYRHVEGLVRAGAVSPVRHVVHVGDVVEHGWTGEVQQALTALAEGQRVLGDPGMTIATGNHDVDHHSDDTRGDTPFLRAFGPGCRLLDGAHVGDLSHGPGGYSSWRRVNLPDGQLAVLALDWRPSPEGLRWADSMLAAHASVPTIVISHDIAVNGALTTHGGAVEGLLDPHPQVFLVIGGHEWPSTRLTRAGREVHAVNYQELPFGGAGAARLYEFLPDEGVCQVISICPSLHRPDVLRSVAARRRLNLSRPEDQFAFSLPPALGGRRAPWQAQGLELLLERAEPGEFRLELPGRYVLEVEATLPAVMHREWQVLLSRLGPAPGSPEPLAAVSLSSENFLGWMAFTADAEAWATSHEYPPGDTVTLVIANGDRGGVWIDGDPVGRINPAIRAGLVDGPWRWRLGGGEYEGVPADPFRGRVTRLRAWG